jgi:hypothetical protein
MARKSKSRFYLDTSILYQIMQLDAKLKHFVMSKLTTPGKTIASYYTIVEINKYFLVHAINLYKTVAELRSIEAGELKLANTYGRQPKNYLIISALVRRNISAHAGMPGYKNYLAELEMFIVTMQDEFYYMANEFYGTFSKHPLVITRVYSAADFDNFLKVVDESKAIDYSETWEKYTSQLKDADDYFNIQPKLKRKLQREINELIKAVLADPNLTYSKEFQPSKHVGDLTISLNAPASSHVLAHDKSFPEINTALNKNHSYVDSIEKFNFNL